MDESVSPAAGRVFISYRREETAYPAGWLFDRLADRFGRGQIFKDIDSIQLGDDFVEVITAAVGSCDVLLALIGDRWLTITDEQGRARLDDPEDFVRLELEAALTRNVRVIPILVEGARMPRAGPAAAQPGQAGPPPSPGTEPRPLRVRHRPAAQGAGPSPRRCARPTDGHHRARRRRQCPASRAARVIG